MSTKKWAIITGILIAIIIILAVIVIRGNKIVSDTKKTVTQQQTKIDTLTDSYSKVVSQLNKEIAKHVSTTATTIIQYKNGQVQTQTVTVTILDTSTINSQATKTSTVTVTAKADTQIAEKQIITEKIKYSRTAIMLGAFDSGMLKDMGLNLGMQVDNYQFTINYGILRKEFGLDVKTTLLAW